MVPEICEFLHLPSWNSMRPDRAKYWDRAAWLSVSNDNALSLRRRLLQSSIEAFEPDAIFVDYLPYGVAGELQTILPALRCNKYFILRGVVDTADREFLAGVPARVLGELFDRILVTADRRVVDVVEQCQLDEATTRKVEYVGYVSPRAIDRSRIRVMRNLGPQQQWVVCSAGGGMKGEAFLQSCISVASRMTDVTFDVIFGSMSNETLAAHTPTASPNCRVLRECRDLPELHAASDVVINGGGYNSILEAISGGARIIVHPVRTGQEDEQRLNALLLSEYYPIALLEDPEILEEKLCQELHAARITNRPAANLHFAGVERIRAIVLKDLDKASWSKHSPSKRVRITQRSE